MTAFAILFGVMVLGIFFLGFMVAGGRKEASEQQAEDDEQMAALMEHRLALDIENDLFADEVKTA